MTEWKLKRFWTEASVSEAEGGYAVLLDGRGVKTPAKTSLVVPTVELARAIADEWDAQEGTIDPTSMPFTRSANAAIDKVTHQFDEVVNLLAEYGETDLLCYRADSPIELTQRQAQAWDPLLGWAKDTLGADLSPAKGVMFVEQPARSLNHLKTVLLDQSAFQLTATYDLISISGSLILGLAVCKGKISAQEAWDLSRIDEIWQIEQWGED
ncbi:MAG: ATP12 family chaperone protein, partial [Paracoccaceae bacterium]